MKRLFILLICVVSAQAFSNYQCRGQVQYLGSNNGLHISNGFGVHKICEFTIEDQKEMCKAWLSMVLSAQAQKKEVVIFYKDATGKENDACSNVGNWVTPSDEVYFFRVI